MADWALVVLNMGGPDKLESVEPFLINLLSDPELVKLPFPMRLFQKPFARFAARRRLAHAMHGYEDLGGGSPLLQYTRAQAEGIARDLGALGVRARPFVGMRYWHPFAAETAAAIRALDPEGTIVISLYPQFSPATGGSSIGDMVRALRAVGLADRNLVLIDRYPVLPGYVDATVASVKRGLATMGTPSPHLFFSAHGLPQKYIDRGDPYRAEIELTYRAVLAGLAPSTPTCSTQVGGPGSALDCSLSFQSRVGPSEWLRPYTEDSLAALAQRGVKRVLMVPLGFVSDHIETLHEMDETYAGIARGLGMEFHRTPALNDDPIFTKALAALALQRIEERRASPPMETPCPERSSSARA